ncbi:MAG: M24 family metallopeptidase [Nitrososphaerales archaeon]
MLYNRRRAADYLEENDLKALVATTTFNVAYFTDFDCWQYRDFRENMATPGASNTLLQTYAVYVPDRDPVLVTSTGSVQFTDELRGIERRTYGGAGMELPSKRKDGGRSEPKDLSLLREAVRSAEPTPQEALVSALEDLGVRKGRVGIEFSNLTRAARKHIEKKMDRVDWRDATELARLIRMVKTPQEVERMRASAEITEEGLKATVKAARAGVTGGELYQAFLGEVARRGAVPDHFIYNPLGFGISSSPRARFRAGGNSMIDFGVIYRQYYSDTGTTVLYGPNREAEKTYGALAEIFESHVDLLKPGTTPSTVLDAFGRSYRERGMKGVGYQGHGIGLQTREHPVINRTDHKTIADDVVEVGVDIPFEEGMVINIETPMDVLGVGSYQIERTFRITGDRPEELTPRREGAPFLVA